MLHYRVEGSGPPLLLIHGWGVTYAIWQNMLPLLRPHFMVVMIELPGVGGSPVVDNDDPYYPACAEAIDEVRQHLNIEQWDMLSYSLGTRAAEAYVQRYPQCVKHVAFLCPIYLQEIWAFFVRLLDAPHPLTLTQWVFSDWRLYTCIRALGFNWRRHDYTYAWMNEITLQPLDILVRSLAELPGKGTAPFALPPVPALFIWGLKDALTRRPRHPLANDVVIDADHSAPMMAASNVAEVVLPFLFEGKVVNPVLSTRHIRRSPLSFRSLQEVEKGMDTVRARERVRLISFARKVERQRFNNASHSRLSERSSERTPKRSKGLQLPLSSTRPKRSTSSLLRQPKKNQENKLTSRQEILARRRTRKLNSQPKDH